MSQQLEPIKIQSESTLSKCQDEKSPPSSPLPTPSCINIGKDLYPLAMKIKCKINDSVVNSSSQSSSADVSDHENEMTKYYAKPALSD